MFSLDNEVAVVTGGTGVLGGAMAEALANAGAAVAIVGRNRARGEERVRTIVGSGGLAEFFEADVLDCDGLKRIRQDIEQKLGSISILLNAAGGNKPGATLMPGAAFGSLTVEEWKGVFDLNLIGGVLLPTQIFTETMLKSGCGSVINIASLSGITPLSRVIAYSASKAAVINLTQFLAREWATTGVRVNAISPGFFPAEQNRALLYNLDGSYSERGAQIIGHTPMGRFGNAKELAGAVVWLASRQASSFVTGQNIVVDGGFSSATI